MNYGKKQTPMLIDPTKKKKKRSKPKKNTTRCAGGSCKPFKSKGPAKTKKRRLKKK